MSRETRLPLLSRLEQARESRVLSMVLGDRPGVETRIAPDLLHLVAQHLRAIGKQARIDVFLYSTGGDIMAGYRLVGLIREYCDHFAVLVPFKCQSTATLISLGADEIVMMPEGQLSPVDPSITGPYNPMIPGLAFQPGGALPVLPVSVEEVVSYVRLAQEVGEIKSEAGLVAVFEKLTADVRPLALGQVYRARTQIRQLSKKLLQSHRKGAATEEGTGQLEQLVKTLTEALYSHDYLISRVEARSIGLDVIDATGDTDTVMAELFSEYVRDLSLFEPFSPMAALKGQPQIQLKIDRAYVETTGRLDVFSTERTLTVQGGQIMDQISHEGWRPE